MNITRQINMRLSMMNEKIQINLFILQIRIMYYQREMRKFYKYLKRLVFSILFLIWTRTDRKPRSKGEREVIEYLNKHNYKYKREFRIKCNTEYQRNIYVDFYLPNEKVFIEYNGRQHYEPVEYFGGQAQFDRQQKRDQWERDYCIKHGIRLIEIPYYENVESYLNRIL